ETPWRKNRGGQIREREVVAPKVALILERMRGEHRAGGKGTARGECRNQRGLPVVRMQDVRSRLQPLRQLDDAFREENETRGIVLVVAFCRSVETRAVEEFVAFDEEDPHAIRRPHLADRAGEFCAAER